MTLTTDHTIDCRVEITPMASGNMHGVPCHCHVSDTIKATHMLTLYKPGAGFLCFFLCADTARKWTAD